VRARSRQRIGRPPGGDFYEALQTPYGARILLGAFRELAHHQDSLTRVAERLDERARRQIAAVDGVLDGDRPGGRASGALFAERFATALLMEFPPGEPVARLVHCGHPEPLLVRAGQVHGLLPDHPGAPLGLGDLLETAPAVRTVPFGPGDRLLLYTDGFIEARDPRGRFLDLPGRLEAHAGRPRRPWWPVCAGTSSAMCTGTWTTTRRWWRWNCCPNGRNPRPLDRPFPGP
jgi:hypothetical protein